MEWTKPLTSIWTRAQGLYVHARCSARSRRQVGDPPIVLIHGLVISGLYMVPTARRLALFHRVFAPDLPGFGRSAKPPHTLAIPELADALAAWMDSLSIEHAVLVGNSLGCQILADFAARRPSRVICAILAGPTMDAYARRASAQFGRWLVDWTRERPSLALAHALDYYRAGLGRAWRTFQYALADRIEEKLPRMQMPTLVVRGSRDAIVSQRWAEEVTRLLPQGRLVIIPGAPHVVNYTTAPAFVQTIRSFLGTAAGDTFNVRDTSPTERSQRF